MPNNFFTPMQVRQLALTLSNIGDTPVDDELNFDIIVEAFVYTISQNCPSFDSEAFRNICYRDHDSREQRPTHSGTKVPAFLRGVNV